jgi:hypothetical protein
LSASRDFRYSSAFAARAFKLLELSTNSTLAGKSAYTLIGIYDLPSSGLQKLMEVGTIIGDRAYSLQYIADAPRYSDYLPTVQKMIDSLVIKKSSGTGIGPMPDNSTKLYRDKMEKCYEELCYVQWSRHLMWISFHNLGVIFLI